MPPSDDPMPLDAWKVESTRVTAFPGEAVATDRISWWDEFAGVDPEAVLSRPKVGQYEAHGDFEGRRLTLAIQPGRIDWVMSPQEQAPDDERRAFLGPFPDVFASLSKIVTPWLTHAPALVRLAVGAVLLQPVDNVHAGYVRLKRYLPALPIDPDGSSDFLYQINRPRRAATQIRDLRLNRLNKWSVQVMQRVDVMLGSQGIATKRTLAQEVACRLELDINTAPKLEPLPPDRLEALLHELGDLAKEIAQRGDV